MNNIVRVVVCMMITVGLVACGGGVSPEPANTNVLPPVDYWTVDADGVTILVSGYSTGSIAITKSTSIIAVDTYIGKGDLLTAPTSNVVNFAHLAAAFLKLPIVLGSSWSWSGITGSGDAIVSTETYTHRVDTTTTITSVSEVVSAASTTFTDCVKTVQAFSYPQGTNFTLYETNIERWFCPGVGITKAVASYSTGLEVSVLLESWSLGVPGDYFPLIVGMTRQYRSATN